MTESGRRLGASIRRLARRERDRPPAHDLIGRLDHLERDVSETRTRVNGLFFGLMAVVLGEIVTRVLAG